MDYLDRIVAYKRRHPRQTSSGELERRVAEAPAVRPFLNRLGTNRTVVIAECKKQSPSRGVLAEKYDPVVLARLYEENGAGAVSVITDEHFFGGSSRDLQAVREATAIPSLRKDFLLDEGDLLEARAWGADIVLLIARILRGSALRTLGKVAEDLGMDSLVEVHDEADLDQALQAGAGLVGINNRNLSTFDVDPAVTERLMELVPAPVVVVSESGIVSGETVAHLREMGIRGVLVGEALITAADPAAVLRELVDAGCPDCWRERRAVGGSS